MNASGPATDVAMFKRTFQAMHAATRRNPSVAFPARQVRLDADRPLSEEVVEHLGAGVRAVEPAPSVGGVEPGMDQVDVARLQAREGDAGHDRDVS